MNIHPKDLLPSILVNKGSRGGFYLYSYKNEWDPIKKRSKRVDSHIIGKILGEDKVGEVLWKEEFIEEYPILKKYKTYREDKEFRFELIESSKSKAWSPYKSNKKYDVDISFYKTYHAGATYALDEIVFTSGIYQALKAAFHVNDNYLKILSLAYFVILNNKENLSEFEEFSEITRLPYSNNLSEKDILSLFKNIKKEQILRFISNLNYAYLSESNINEQNYLLALDAQYIDKQNESKDICFNFDDFKTILLIDKKTAKALYFDSYDDISINLDKIFSNMTNSVSLNEQDKIIYVSQLLDSDLNNLATCIKNDFNFVFKLNVNTKHKFIKDNLNKILNDLQDTKSFKKVIRKNVKSITIPFDNLKLFKDVKSKKDIYLHFFFDDKLKEQDELFFYEKLKKIISKLQDEETLDSKQEQYIKDNFIIEDKNDIFKYRVNKNNVDDIYKFYGVSLLISDCIDSPIEAYLAFKDRDFLEKSFINFKERFALEHFSSNKEIFFNGKVFIQILANIIFSITNHKLIEYAKKFDNLLLSNTQKDTFKILSSLNNIFANVKDDKIIFEDIKDQKEQYLKFLNIEKPEN